MIICRESNLRSFGICRKNNLRTFGTNVEKKITHFVRKFLRVKFCRPECHFSCLADWSYNRLLTFRGPQKDVHRLVLLQCQTPPHSGRPGGDGPQALIGHVQREEQVSAIVQPQKNVVQISNSLSEFPHF